MTARHSALWIRAVGVLFCDLVVGMGPAQADMVAYVPTNIGTYGGAYLVDWKAGNWARVVGGAGGGIGAFTDDGTQRVVTLGAPLSYLTYSSDLDCFDNQYLQRVDTRQFVFRKVAGSVVNGRTEVVEIGTITALEGCSAGRIVPFGSLTEPGFVWQHRAFSAREPMTDVLPGFTIAGFTEGPGDDADPIGGRNPLGVDVVRLETPSSLRFQRTGTVVPAALDAEQWLMLQMPGFQRGYTRIAFDKASGAEIWLGANFRDGVPVQVDSAMMIKPVAGISFGSGARSSRMWESAVGLGTDTPFFFHLYRDRTGERVSRDLTTGDEFRDPTTWRFSGSDIVQNYGYAGGRKRTWTPLARNGPYMFVFEKERTQYPGDPPRLNIPPRVNFYVDRGPAVRP